MFFDHVCYGRFQPFTIAHRAMVEAMIENAKNLSASYGCENSVFIVPSKRPAIRDERNPLTSDRVFEILNTEFSTERIVSVAQPEQNVFTALLHTSSRKCADKKVLHYYCGPDRVSAFTDILKRFRKDTGYDEIFVQGFSEPKLQVRATNLRDLARIGDFGAFGNLCGFSNPVLCREVAEEIRAYFGNSLIDNPVITQDSICQTQT